MPALIESKTTQFVDARLEHFRLVHDTLSVDVQPGGVQARITVRNACDRREIHALSETLSGLLARQDDMSQSTVVDDVRLAMMARDLDDARRALMSEAYLLTSQLMVRGSSDVRFCLRLNRICREIERDLPERAYVRAARLRSALEAAPREVLVGLSNISKDQALERDAVRAALMALYDVIMVLSLLTGPVASMAGGTNGTEKEGG